MSEKKSLNTPKDKPVVLQLSQPEPSATGGVSGFKCMKRRLFAASPTDDTVHDDDAQFNTPPKRKRGPAAPLCFESSPCANVAAGTGFVKCGACTSTPSSSNQSRASGPHNVPLSERQQLAMILKMTDETTQPDISSKPTSPVALPHKRTPADKKINKRNERGETILHLVAIKGDTKMTKKYIKAGADVNARDFAGWTALHEACNHGWIDVTRQLLKAGANVNAQGLDNDTPLHDASGNGHTKLVELLVKHGANPLQVNRKGKSPIDVAASEDIVQLLKKEILSSNSECSSVDDVRSPTSPESASSTREDEQQSNLDDFCTRVSSQMAPRVEASLIEPFKTHTVSKSPDNKSHSPRLFLKFQHIKFKDSRSCDSSEAAAKEPYKSYSVTLDTSERDQECFSPFNSASSNESDLNESKLDIGRRLKAVDASITEQDDLIEKRGPRSYAGPEAPYITTSTTQNLKHHLGEAAASQFSSSLPQSSRSRAFETSFPPLLMETLAESSGQPMMYKPFGGEERPIPALYSEASHLTVTSSSYAESDVGLLHFGAPRMSDADAARGESSSGKPFRYLGGGESIQENPVNSSMNSSVNSSMNSSVNSSVTASILCERTGEHLPVSSVNADDAAYLAQQAESVDGMTEPRFYPDPSFGAYRASLESDAEFGSKSAPKVPPLKIIMPTKSSTLSHATDSVNCAVSKMSLPYVVNSAHAIESEAATSSSAFNLNVANVSMFAPCVSTSTEVARITGDDVATSSTDLLPFSAVTAVAESTCGEENKPVSENEASEGDAKEGKEERRITRSLVQKLQQKEKSDKQGSDSNDANDSSKTSRGDEIVVDETSMDMPPRKRKLRPKPEPIVTEIPPPNPMSLYELPPNPYQIYLSLKRSLWSRQEGLLVVQPKEPQGFKDYLMVSCGYVLQGNAASTLAVPMLSPPNSVTGGMRDLFSQQEKARYKLRLQHLVEREKLTLASEQEILRVHGRAARAMANQSLPLSVCTVLKDEEQYPTTDFDQMDDRDKNIRSRYNGRQFLSWLQDVADKYDKLKEFLILRHHHEAESLFAVQKMDWEWKMKAVGLCDHNVTPKIDELHVPMVQVSDD